MPNWLHFGVILAVLGGSGVVLGRLGRVLAPLGGLLGRLWPILCATWRVLARLGHLQASKIGKSLKNERKNIKNHPQHKHDLTWNGKRRSF